MKLAQLLSPFQNFKMGEDPLREVTGLCIDSRRIEPGQVFIAIRGHVHDSHLNLPDVCSRGAIGVVVEDTSRIPTDFKGAILKTQDTKSALVKLASTYFGHPAEKLFCVGVTGTNGKTSTTYLIETLFNEFGLKTGVIGTINHHLGEKIWPSELTTPDAITLQRRMRDFVALEAKAVAFEVSSHAIDQGRAEGISFSCVIFTNLTRDHLDYHKNMDDYFAAKEKLFSELIAHPSEKSVVAIINADDEWGKKIRVASRAQHWTYGESQSDFQFQILESSFSGTRFRLNCPRGVIEMRSPLIGRHNVYNAVAAIAATVAAGASLEVCVQGLKNFKGVPGRLQRVESPSQVHVFVDYAHTDDALKTVLSLLNDIGHKHKNKSRIITVFGCGGDRDKGKRPLMAKAAIEGSDYVFVTSDNPRTEDPMRIVQDILTGVPKELLNSKVFVEIDRREAIRRAIEYAHPHDVVLIAGKGHENYQIIGDKKNDFSDVQVAGEILSGL